MNLFEYFSVYCLASWFYGLADVVRLRHDRIARIERQMADDPLAHLGWSDARQMHVAVAVVYVLIAPLAMPVEMTCRITRPSGRV